MSAFDVPPPARPYVEALGLDRAAEFLLRFGGATFGLAADPKGGSEFAEFLGLEQTRQLMRRLRAGTDHGYVRVPTVKPFLAAYLAGQGLTQGRIARRLHVTDYTVRGWLKRTRAASPPQLSLL
jgi:hypothetical protein